MKVQTRVKREGQIWNEIKGEREQKERDLRERGKSKQEEKEGENERERDRQTMREDEFQRE